MRGNKNMKTLHFLQFVGSLPEQDFLNLQAIRIIEFSYLNLSNSGNERTPFLKRFLIRVARYKEKIAEIDINFLYLKGLSSIEVKSLFEALYTCNNLRVFSLTFSIDVVRYLTQIPGYINFIVHALSAIARNGVSFSIKVRPEESDDFDLSRNNNKFLSTFLQNLLSIGNVTTLDLTGNNFQEFLLLICRH